MRYSQGRIQRVSCGATNQVIAVTTSAVIIPRRAHHGQARSSGVSTLKTRPTVG